jgi:hypothetical protein
MGTKQHQAKFIIIRKVSIAANTFNENQDNPVSIVTRLCTRRLGLDAQQGQTFFCSHYDAQTVSAAH